MIKERYGRVGLLYRMKAYFVHGHGSWTGFMVSVGTFLIVLYGYGIEYVSLFRQLFYGNPLWYLLIAIPSYFLLAGSIGYWSYNYGPFSTRMGIDWRNNPEYQKLKKKVKENNEKLSVLEEKMDTVIGHFDELNQREDLIKSVKDVEDLLGGN